MSDAELVSVVIPVYNAARFLADAIRSVQAQRHAPIEIIVVDDGSTDGSGDVARSFSGVRCFSQPNRGIAAARNAGVLQVRGTLLAFQDADDLWTGGKLALQLDVLRTRPDVNFVVGGVEQFFDAAIAPPSTAAAAFAAQTATINTACAGTILIRTLDFQRVGLFNPALRLGEFIDWYSRAINLGLREHRVDQVVLKRRIHGGNTTVRQRGCSGDYLSVIKAHLQRKRRAA
jgi:glycosyltransferase involved in cell wall biosynthesis